jgi:hypothetical protein
MGLSEFEKLQKGDILIIPYSDVGWTPLFSKAGAVISESGGMLSHSSIIAREYHIPGSSFCKRGMQYQRWYHSDSEWLYRSNRSRKESGGLIWIGKFTLFAFMYLLFDWFNNFYQSCSKDFFDPMKHSLIRKFL